MYAKIIRVKCSHSSKPLHGCEIFRKDARLLGTYFKLSTHYKNACAKNFLAAPHYYGIVLDKHYSNAIEVEFCGDETEKTITYDSPCSYNILSYSHSLKKFVVLSFLTGKQLSLC